MEKILKFLVVGGTTNLLSIGVYWLLLEFNMIPEIATIIVGIPAVAIAHHYNRNWAFESNLPYFESMMKYFLTNIATFIVQVITVFVSFRMLGIPPLISQILAVIMTTVLNFTVLKYGIYKTK